MSPKPAFDLAALDIAGTTVREGGVVYRVLRAVIEDRVGGPLPDDVLDRWTGTSKREAVAGLLLEMSGCDEANAVAATYAAFTAALLDAYRGTPPTLVLGAAVAVPRLRSEGVRVVLQTGYDRELAEAVLAAAGWRVGRDIDGLVTSDEVRCSRPAPYLVFHAMELVGARDVSRVIVAGDTRNDVLAGINAGAGLVAGVLSGEGTSRAFSPFAGLAGFHVIADVGELIRLI